MIAKKDILYLETRRKIYNYVLEHPGVHLRGISKKLHINVVNVRYHLEFLTKQGIIITNKENGYLRFFVSKVIGNNEKKILSLLRQKTPLHIIVAFLWEFGLSSKELCELLGKSPSTINFHLKKLLENDIIEVAPHGKGVVYRKKPGYIIERSIVGREVVYRLKDYHKVYTTIIMYRDSILDDKTMEIFDVVNISFNWKTPRINRTFDDSIDNLIKNFFEIFPNPFYC